jgi:putative transposase
MSRYRRAHGSTFFFTVVSYRRQRFLCHAALRTALRYAITAVRCSRPFTIDAWVLLPDHMHCIWTLPPDDGDFSQRWKIIKRMVSSSCQEEFRRAELITPSRLRSKESTIWQRRFWEHRIVDDHDFAQHADYIHYNPVKHGLVKSAADWPYSTFHQFVQRGIYGRDWAASADNLDSRCE